MNRQALRSIAIQLQLGHIDLETFMTELDRYWPVEPVKGVEIEESKETV